MIEVSQYSQGLRNITHDIRKRSGPLSIHSSVSGIEISRSALQHKFLELIMGLQSDADNMDPKAKANQSIRWYETVRMQPGGFLDVEEDYGEGQTRQVCEFKYGFELRMRDEYDRAKVRMYFGMERTHSHLLAENTCASSGRRTGFTASSCRC